MNIVIFGSGAIGSLFGALLSNSNNVILYGRKPHVDVINKEGLKINGKTLFNKKLPAICNIKEIKTDIDLLILSVKSFDTDRSLKIIKNIIDNNTIILTIQNGLDNIDKIRREFNYRQIMGGVTTQGSIFVKPGFICHTGIGETILGELDGTISDRLKIIVKLFNNSEIITKYSNDINKEIWIKTIINSSINPLTTIFQCKNGYLLKNPILSNIVKFVCNESIGIAIAEGFDVNYDDILNKTKKVINDTCDNYSSMLQSYKKHKKTEINSINGKLIEIGKKRNVDVTLNELFVLLVESKNYNFNKK